MVICWSSPSAEAKSPSWPRSVWHCLWGHALKRSPGIIRKSRVSYPGRGFLYSATWPLLLKKHYNGLNQTVLNGQRREAKEGKTQHQNPRSITRGAVVGLGETFNWSLNYPNKGGYIHKRYLIQYPLNPLEIIFGTEGYLCTYSTRMKSGTRIQNLKSTLNIRLCGKLCLFFFLNFEVIDCNWITFYQSVSALSFFNRT